MRRGVLLVALGALALANAGPAFAAPAAGRPRVEAALGRETVFKGEGVEYEVRVLDVDVTGAPELPPSDDYEAVLVAENSLAHASMVIHNGVVRRDETKGHRWSYRLTPRRTGMIDVAPAVYRHDGKTLRSPSLRFAVIGPQPSDLVAVDAKVDREGRLPLQKFRVRLRIFVKRLPAPYADRDPVALDVRLDAPALNVPWVEEIAGLKTGSLNEWLSGLGTRRRGFTLNELKYNDSGPFSLLAEARLAVFDLGGRPATEADVAGVDGLVGVGGTYRDWYVYELTRTYEPRRPGTYSFAASSVRGDFVATVRGAEPLTKTVFVEGGALEVVVDDAPAQGRPAGYANAFGRAFDLAAQVSPARARVGDPLTYTVTVSGDGNVEAMGAPDLGAIDEFAERFRVEKPQDEARDGARVFTWTLRAISEAVTEVPPLPLAFYDVAKERYSVASSSALPLKVEQVGNLAAGDIVSAQPGATASLERADGLFGNRLDPDELRDERVSARTTFAIVGALALLHALLSLGLALRERALGDPKRVRRRGAARRARERLAAARERAASGDEAGSIDAAREAVLGLVADAALLPEAGLTPREASKVLAAANVDEALRARAAQWLDRLEASRFGGESSGARLVEDGADLAERLVEALEQAGRLR